MANPKLARPAAKKASKLATETVQAGGFTVQRPVPIPTTPPPPADPKKQTKQAMVLALLRQEDGVKLDAIVGATGWQPHTARAALTGLKKKGHDVRALRTSDGTFYFVP